MTHQTNYAEKKGFVKTDFWKITKFHKYALLVMLMYGDNIGYPDFFANPNTFIFGT